MRDQMIVEQKRPHSAAGPAILERGTPKVSVIILTFNRPHLIGRAIQSVCEQDYQDWEIVVVHDGPNEATTAVMNQWLEREPRIRYFRRNQTGNIADAANFALCQAEGEYIAILDDDDYWATPHKLTYQVAFLEENPEYVGCGGGVVVVNQDSQEVLRYLKPESDEQIKRRALVANPMVNSTTLYRRSTAEQFGGYDSTALTQFQDWDFWLKMGTAGKLYNVPDYLTYYAIWENGSSFRHLKANGRAALKIVWRHRSSYSQFGVALAFAFGYYAYAHLPERVRAASFGFLSRLKKSLFAQKTAPTPQVRRDLDEQEV